MTPGNIPDEIDRELRVCVERVVRPITASSWRKDRMREELLGHLIQTYHVERATSEDPLANTKRRFGDPAVLRQPLQESVPRWERWLFLDVTGEPGMLRWMRERARCRDDQPVWRNALRYMLFQGLLPAALAVAVVTPLAALLPDRSLAGVVRNWDAIAATLVMWSAMSACFIMIARPMSHALIHSRRGHVLLWSAAWCVAAMALAVGQWTVMLDWQFIWTPHLAVWLAAAALSVAPILLLAVLHRRDVERHDRWLDLDLTESA